MFLIAGGLTLVVGIVAFVLLSGSEGAAHADAASAGTAPTG
jgi:preprotein translocase subunit SecG